jgi:hypothetical protein
MTMKKTTRGGTPEAASANGQESPKKNGNGAAVSGTVATALAESNGELANLSVILAGLQTMRNGDFSVRLPGNLTGLAGKVADTFNDIVSANQQMSQELKRVGQAVGKEGKTRERAKFYEPRGMGRNGMVGKRTGGRPIASDYRSDARDRGCRPGQFGADGTPGCERQAVGRRVSAVGEYRQHHDSAIGSIYR